MQPSKSSSSKEEITQEVPTKKKKKIILHVRIDPKKKVRNGKKSK